MSGKESHTDELWPTLIEFVIATRGWFVAVCAELDLTPAQGTALKALDPERPFPMSSLADAMFCDASNVTGIVDKLESRGLISRQGADHDRRVKQLVVTEPGRQVRDRLIARMLQPPQAVAQIPADVKANLVSVLRAVLAEHGR